MPRDFPIVLIEIDRDSRLHVYQHAGVRVAVIDRRIEPALFILPEAHQPLEMDAAIGHLPLHALGVGDDLSRTAAEMLRRLHSAEIVVAATPVFPKKEPANG